MNLPITLSYKHIGSLYISVDVFLPTNTASTGDPTRALVPAVVYFHGGGLTVGNRESWFPSWLKDRITAAGFAFLSADYRLVPPSTGHQILEDIRDLFHFLDHKLNDSLLVEAPLAKLQIDPARIAVAGTSAGGLCAYLAAMHAQPRPKALVSFYGMGGDFITSHYLHEKKEVFFRGRELLDPESFSAFLFPSSRELTPISDSPLVYHPLDSPTPGYPANPRMQLARLYLQMGNLLDYYTGQHNPSLSQTLHDVLAETAANDAQRDDDRYLSLIPDSHHTLFPQLANLAEWPPTLLVHGSIDTAVPVHESIHLHDLLQRAGVTSTLKIVDGQEHSFDYAPDASSRFGTEGELFDQVRDFLLQIV